MKNYFTRDGISKNLDRRSANVLLHPNYADLIERIDIANGKKIYDLEGFDFDKLGRLDNCGPVSMVLILSYYLSHGYVMDETGCLRKNYEKHEQYRKQDVSDETLLSTILSKKTAEKLKKKGIVKVSDLIGKTYREVVGKEDNDKNVKQWFEITGKLAGHGYEFYSLYKFRETKSSIIGMIRKAPIEYFPELLLSETKSERKQREREKQEEKLSCNECARIKALEKQLLEMTKERDAALAKLKENDAVVARARRITNAEHEKNKSLEAQLAFLKEANRNLKDCLANREKFIRNSKKI